MFDPKGPAAAEIATLGWVLLDVCVVIYVAVLGGLAWSLMRRRLASDDSPQTASRIGVVITSLAVLTTMVLIVFVAVSAFAGRGLTSPTGPGAITVDVVGYQWWWDFR